VQGMGGGRLRAGTGRPWLSGLPRRTAWGIIARMEWPLDTIRAAQAAAVLLRDRPGRRDNFMRVLKLLYLANRAALQEAGRPIFSDRFVAMRRGPLPGGVYDLIKGVHRDVGEWARYFRTDRYDLVLVDDADPGVGALTRFDVETLRRVAEEHADRDEWALVDETHRLPEWIRNDPGDSSRTIPLADLLDALGMRGREQAIRDEMARRGRVRAALLGRTA